MNTYDPSDHIRYVHLTGPAVVRPVPADGAVACTALPGGYANQSPRTRLQRRPAQAVRTLAVVASLPA
jgi:hypothetical protein